MGPTDPFAPPAEARRPAPPAAPASLSRPVDATTVDRPRRGPGRPSATLVGAAAGLVFGVLAITVGLGPALVVLAFAGVGAALGALVRVAVEGGLDLAGAWRALRRR